MNAYPVNDHFELEDDSYPEYWDEDFGDPDDGYDIIRPADWALDFDDRDPYPAPQISPSSIAVTTMAACLILLFLLLRLSTGLNFPPAQSDTAVNDSARSDNTSLEPALKRKSSKGSDGSGPAAGSSASQAACKVSGLFPNKVLRWCGLISYYAARHELNPDLLAALIWLESGGNEIAYSKSGAVGLMQVMPKDGLASSFMCVNGPCFADRPSITELQDPEFNVAYGTRMLAGLLRRHGSLREALRYYGPMNVGYYYADKVLGIYQRYRNTP